MFGGILSWANAVVNHSPLFILGGALYKFSWNDGDAGNLLPVSISEKYNTSQNEFALQYKISISTLTLFYDI